MIQPIHIFFRFVSHPKHCLYTVGFHRLNVPYLASRHYELSIGAAFPRIRDTELFWVIPNLYLTWGNSSGEANGNFHMQIQCFWQTAKHTSVYWEQHFQTIHSYSFSYFSLYKSPWIFIYLDHTTECSYLEKESNYRTILSYNWNTEGNRHFIPLKRIPLQNPRLEVESKVTWMIKYITLDIFKSQ